MFINEQYIERVYLYNLKSYVIILMFFDKYLLLLEIEDIVRVCSKPYGFELLILLYNQTKNNTDDGIEDTFNAILFNRSQRPAFINFINELEYKGIISRQISIKKSKTLLRLNQNLMDKIFYIHIYDPLAAALSLSCNNLRLLCMINFPGSLIGFVPKFLKTLKNSSLS